MSGQVVVVGGGLAGLTAGLVAARAGAGVTVIEARSSVGGRARSEERGGVAVNQGAHALYVDGEAASVLHELGIDTPGWVPDQTGARAVVRGGLAALPVGPMALARTSLLDWRAKIATGRLLAQVPRLDAASLTGTSVTDWLDAATADPDVTSLVRAVLRLSTYADDPDHLDAGAAVTQLQRSLHGGVRYLHGGWQGLVDQLRCAVIAEGATVRTDAKVTAVVPVAGGGARVELAGAEPLPADAVVLAAGGPARAADLLGPAGARLRTVADRAVPATVTALDVVLDGPWAPTPRFALGIDEATYLSVHTPPEPLRPRRSGPSIAPRRSDGPDRAGTAGARTLVALLAYHRADQPPDPDARHTRRRLEAMLELVRPGWRSTVVDERFHRHAVVAHDVPGAATGGLGGRATVHAAGHPAILVAGDWVGPHGLLADAAAASAAAAGRAATGRAAATTPLVG